MPKEEIKEKTSAETTAWVSFELEKNNTEMSKIKTEIDGLQKKGTFLSAATQSGLTTLAIASITLGLSLAAGNIVAGSALIVLGIAIFVVNYYYGDGNIAL
jgi:hypothetical protein